MGQNLHLKEGFICHTYDLNSINQIRLFSLPKSVLMVVLFKLLVYTRACRYIDLRLILLLKVRPKWKQFLPADLYFEDSSIQISYADYNLR